MSGKAIIIFLILAPFVTKLKAQCTDTNIAFKSGEKVYYHAYYNWGFIWVNAGDVKFLVDKATYDGQEPAYLLRAYGRTYSSYDFLFKVRDTFEVYVDTMNLKPYEFYRVTNEGSTHTHHHYIFDRENKTIHTSISKDNGPYKNSVIPWPDCSFDLLSMVYKARNIDFDKYKPGDKIPINMVLDGKTYNLYIRYKGREKKKNRDGRKFNCLKFSPLLVDGTIFTSGEGMTVWVTDDKNRIPIIVEAKILIGSVKAVFIGAEGLRHPIEAEITK
ncbi:MAG: DUF3108 domain-containing protein [Chlorobi bacterium]|nr:DUF3108 domain-containing protein [Chlorobiota bacterium]